MPADIPQFSRYLELYSSWAKSSADEPSAAQSCSPTDAKDACGRTAEPSCTKRRDELTETAAS